MEAATIKKLSILKVNGETHLGLFNPTKKVLEKSIPYNEGASNNFRNYLKADNANTLKTLEFSSGAEYVVQPLTEKSVQIFEALNLQFENIKATALANLVNSQF